MMEITLQLEQRSSTVIQDNAIDANDCIRLMAQAMLGCGYLHDSIKNAMRDYLEGEQQESLFPDDDKEDQSDAEEVSRDSRHARR